MGGRSRLFGERLVTAMEIPRDLACQDALVTVTGRTRLCIENYRNIVEYTPSRIVVQTKNGRIGAEGSSLELLSYTSETMLITGHLARIFFC